MKLNLIFIITLALTANVFATETGFKLSARTIAHYREFQDEVKDVQVRAKLMKRVLAVVPFRHLLEGKVAPDTALEIADEDWELYVKAMRGVDTLALGELQKFAGAEAVSTDNTIDDQRFWRKIYDQLGKARAPGK